MADPNTNRKNDALVVVNYMFIVIHSRIPALFQLNKGVLSKVQVDAWFVFLQLSNLC